MAIKTFHLMRSVLAFCCFLKLTGCATVEDVAPLHSNSSTGWVNVCVDWDEWDKAGPAFRVFGNTYYVGTCGISAILITSKDGHILIDGGTEAGADLIINNIEALGFSLSDVKLLLHSHEHFDHVAGLAKLQKSSGARLLASPEAAPVLRTGTVADNDPQAGMHAAFPAARVDGIIQAGEIVKLGGLALTPIATPGHTHGALSWQWQSCEKNSCVSMVYADSLSPVSSDTYHFSEHPEYVDAYQQGLNTLATLNCQILLTPHPSASKMRERLIQTKELIDPNGCKHYAAEVENRLNKRLDKEKLKR